MFHKSIECFTKLQADIENNYFLKKFKNTCPDNDLLVAVPFYVNCETRKSSRKPLKNKINEKK